METAYIVGEPIAIRAGFTGRADLLNGDSQNGICQLLHQPLTGEPAVLIDDTTVRLGEEFGDGAQQSLALQGAFSTPAAGGGDNFIFVTCSTFRGFLLQAVLTAIQVTSLTSPGPFFYQDPPVGSCGTLTDC